MLGNGPSDNRESGFLTFLEEKTHVGIIFEEPEHQSSFPQRDDCKDDDELRISQADLMPIQILGNTLTPQQMCQTVNELQY